MQYKVSELEGPLLDVAVGLAEGLGVERGFDGTLFVDGKAAGGVSEYGPDQNADYSPSIAWHDGGPIIERERISLHMFRSAPAAFAWHSEIEDEAERRLVEQYGPAPLIAAMRAYVAGKYGEFVEIQQ